MELELGFETIIREVAALDALGAISTALTREAMDRRAKGLPVPGHVSGSAAPA